MVFKMRDSVYYLARDNPSFVYVMYCVNGKPRSSILLLRVGDNYFMAQERETEGVLC